MIIGAGWFNNGHLPDRKAENLITAQAKKLDTSATLIQCRKPVFSLDSLWYGNMSIFRQWKRLKFDVSMGAAVVIDGFIQKEKGRGRQEPTLLLWTSL